MNRVLVTGGAGTIGAAVVRRLLRDPDWEVRVSDQRTPPQWMRESCEVRTGDLRVLVETDSWRHHKSRESFEKDRRRDTIHAAAGYRTLRFTWRQITDDPAGVTSALERALESYRGDSAASSVA